MFRHPLRIGILSLLVVGCADPILITGDSAAGEVPWVERAAPIDMAALQLTPDTQRMTLSLFGDVSDVTFQRIRQENGTTIWSGTPADDANGEVTLVRRNDSWAGTIRRHGRLMRLEPSHNGTIDLIVIDEGAMPLDEEPIPRSGGGLGDLPNPFTGQRRSTIDVFVGYTTQSRIAAGSKDAMEATIALAMEESNTGYSDSGIPISLRLAGTREVSGVEIAGDWANTLDDLRSDDDGFADEVHAERDATGADEVVLIVEDSTACGIAYVMTDPGPGFEGSAFALVSRTCATGYYSFGHEIGHNMGSAHHASFGEQAAFDFSYGHRDPDSAFRTVMAYNCSGGCQRINRWSDPDALHDGSPLGAPDSADDPANNVVTLEEVRAIVADFREPESPIGPGIDFTAPTADTITGGHVELAWNSSTSIRVTIGQSPGVADYAETTTSLGTWHASGLPVDGTPVWVSLHGPDGRVDREFSTSPSTGVSLILPATTLNRAEQVFEWTHDGSPRFRFSVGTASGRADVIDVISDDPRVATRTLPNQTLFVRIGTEAEGEWRYTTQRF
ncbi:MAG: hypothetical protein ACJAZO_003922 [Myxococcota bacterium]|jgi:hypothetical protein